MESMKMKLMVVLMVAIVAFSAVGKAAAQDAPAPSPTSDATMFVPALFASVVALASGFLF
ncbi:hypothetical protein AALP_AA3G148700 [Arabis alpina]|uniref:Uncharacterized protein n=1 Tax=Arabis alpina TaxID=50452 RepID=A0A087H999_ARAAL|nr:hypothetical protein AALP_AA3G148700 [Arabis alpina]